MQGLQGQNLRFVTYRFLLFISYPCGWSSFVEQQAFHLDIALRSSGTAPGSRGYTYGQLTQIAAAANATRSPIIMEWWTPGTSGGIVGSQKLRNTCRPLTYTLRPNT